ncbi:cation:proton antiporter [Actinokineospora inagensis]|uniref:cation:proton antiporter n=1 Tax=Actinokineospora inagensis TaxID=103730 RepID=UPI0003FB78BF|nr:cation:proton antiporter [Actinokineospora inagensis]
MNVADFLLRGTHAAAALTVVLAVGRLGRAAARRLRQPEVIGEIVAGLVAGPAAVAVLGARTFAVMLPGRVVDLLKLCAEVGLVLFLLGLAHRFHQGEQRPPRRAAYWVVAGGLAPALLSGVAFAGWILLAEDHDVRGNAPLPAFLLMCGVALSITAVPVLARILADRGATDTSEGRLSMTAAVVIDTVGWLLLSATVGLASGRPHGLLQAIAVLTCGVLVASAVRYALRGQAATALCRSAPAITAVFLAVLALAVALGVEHLGLTAILGAVLIGLAVPADDSWARVVASVTRVGRALVPVFFVVTGLTVFAAGIGTLSWSLIVVATVFAVVGKGAGSYLGARMAGEDSRTAAKVGVLMNTRGLTELIVLKVGHDTGILTPPVFVALVVMAVATTSVTGPLLLVLDRCVPRTAADTEGTAG